jgi:hypothetical protein
VSGAPVPRRLFKESRSTSSEAGGNRGTPIDRAPHEDPSGIRALKAGIPANEDLSSRTHRNPTAATSPTTASTFPIRSDSTPDATCRPDPKAVPSQGIQTHHGRCTGRSQLQRGFPLPALHTDLMVCWSAFPGGVSRPIWHLNPIIPMNARRVLPIGWLTRLATILVLLFWVATRAEAGRPQAENIIFGSIWANGRPVTTTNLVIEARRGDVGPVVARYRLGDDPGAGDLFFLKIQRETAPALSPVSVDSSEPLTLVVTVAGKRSFLSRVQLPSPGRCVRVDFGRQAEGAMVTLVALPPANIPAPTVPATPASTPRRGRTTEETPTHPTALASTVMPMVGRRWVLR